LSHCRCIVDTLLLHCCQTMVTLPPLLSQTTGACVQVV
jgi:hypothetical protein